MVMFMLVVIALLQAFSAAAMLLVVWQVHCLFIFVRQMREDLIDRDLPVPPEVEQALRLGG